MKTHSLSACCGLVFLLASSAHAQLPTTKILTIDVANAIAQEAMTKCRADGFHVSVAIVDAGNFMKAFVRDDGASNASSDVSRLKAGTAVVYGRPSRPAPPPAGAPPAAMTAGVLPNTVIGATGGVPIKAGEQIIGAIGVSGAPQGDRDEACALAALAKFADKLK